MSNVLLQLFFFVVLFIISELELPSNLRLSNLVEMYRDYCRKTDNNMIITYQVTISLLYRVKNQRILRFMCSVSLCIYIYLLNEPFF